MRVRWSGDPAATVTIESPLGSKTFTGVRTGSLLAHTFTSPTGYPAGEFTVTAHDGSGAVTGLTSTTYSARSCG